jgi:Tol biopolymer transport system component
MTTGFDPSDAGYDIDWAPNGLRFVFAARVGDERASRLYIVRRDGSNLHSLTTGGKGYGDSAPEWSPTGGRIIFHREYFDAGRIKAVRVEAKGFTDVAGGGDPHWFPGGGKIVFVRSDGSHRYQVFKETVPPDFNNHNVQISSSPHKSEAENFAPDIAPGGGRIVYTRMFNDLHISRRHWALRVLNADGSHDHLLTKARRVLPNPEWSPGGHRIVFVGRRRGNNDIYTIRGDGTGLRRLTRSPASEADPTWSPDGSRIAFGSLRDGNKEIYVMRRDGSHERRITFSPEVDEDPVWAPSGPRRGSTSP